MITAIKTFGSILCGVVVAGALIATVEWFGHQMAGRSAAMPFIAAIAGYGVGGFAGALLARHLGPKSAVSGWSVIGALGALATINLFAFPHPVWFAPLATAILGLSGWTAAKVKP